MLLPTRHSPRGPLGCTSPRATSRAFVKESDRADKIPEIPISVQLNHVAPRLDWLCCASGLGRCKANARACSRKAQTSPPMPGCALSNASCAGLIRACRVRHWSSPRASHRIALRSAPPCGSWRGWQRVKQRIVGEDEADAERGEVSSISPLAQALLGARAGDPSEMASPAPRYPHRTARNPLRHVNAALSASALNGFFPTSRRADWRSCFAPIAATMQACNGSYVHERLHA